MWNKSRITGWQIRLIRFTSQLSPLGFRRKLEQQKSNWKALLRLYSTDCIIENPPCPWHFSPYSATGSHWIWNGIKLLPAGNHTYIPHSNRNIILHPFWKSYPKTTNRCMWVSAWPVVVVVGDSHELSIRDSNLVLCLRTSLCGKKFLEQYTNPLNWCPGRVTPSTDSFQIHCWKLGHPRDGSARSLLSIWSRSDFIKY